MNGKSFNIYHSKNTKTLMIYGTYANSAYKHSEWNRDCVWILQNWRFSLNQEAIACECYIKWVK